jgi:predicted O-methyltransferase YrrM
MTYLDLAIEAIDKHKAVQKLPELSRLLASIEGLRFETVLEIGTERGGTLWLWTQIATDDATIVSVDLKTWPGIVIAGRAKQRLHRIEGDSHEEEIFQLVYGALPEGKVDLLFIDGDHTYEGVKRDFDMYAPLVGEHGLIILHDIAPHDPSQSEAHVFWAQLKDNPYLQCEEFIFGGIVDLGWAKLPEHSCGLGTVRVQS